MAEFVSQSIGTAGSEERQGLHAKFNVWNLLVWLYTLDLGSRKKISTGGANPVFFLELPPRRCVASNGEFGDVSIMQVGESCIGIFRSVARQVTPRVKSDW